MDHGNEMDDRPRTLRGYFLRAFRESSRQKPVSFYLLIAIVVMLFAGTQLAFVRDDPYRFAFYLSLHFVFFIVVAYRALVDFFEIARGHFRERERVFRTTLGEDQFVQQLGERITRHHRAGDATPK